MRFWLAAALLLQLVDALIALNEPLTQFLVLLIEAAKLHDHLVEEVIYLVLVVSLAEFCRLESLVDYVFWSQSHGRHL